MEVHQCLDTFELRVLAWPASSMDVSTLQAAVESLGADLDMILEARVPESDASSTEPPKDTVLAELFYTAAVPQPLQRDYSKMHKVRDKVETRGRKGIAESWRLQEERLLLMMRPAS